MSPRSWLARLVQDVGGGLSMVFTVAIPVVLTVGVGAVDLMSVNADQTKAQDVVDAAALASAKQLSLVDSSGIGDRAKILVDDELASMKGRFTYEVSTKVADDLTGVTVTVTGKRLSFFGNMLPPGGWPIHVSATAGSMGKTPLCVLTSDLDTKKAMELGGQSRLTAGQCMVHSNGDIAVSGGAWLQASTVQASGRATGRISPTPQQSGPVIEDPFAGISVSTPRSLCVPLDEILSIGLRTLPPGVHCGNFVAPKSSTLRLLPGEHYFIGRLELQDNAVLEGSNVVLIFDKKSNFKFAGQSKVDLTGRTSGRFAGFVIATTRQNDHTFKISSDSARRLLGTVYIPSATLEVSGTGNKVADQSPWTVIVAKEIKMTGSANLVINSNYIGSGVPVPNGVGPVSNKVALTR